MSDEFRVLLGKLDRYLLRRARQLLTSAHHNRGGIPIVPERVEAFRAREVEMDARDLESLFNRAVAEAVEKRLAETKPAETAPQVARPKPAPRDYLAEHNARRRAGGK